MRLPLVTCGTVLQNEVMPRAMRALKRALQVKSPVVNNLTLPRTCNVTFISTGACSQYYSLDHVCQGALPETPPAELFRGEKCASDLPVTGSWVNNQTKTVLVYIVCCTLLSASAKVQGQLWSHHLSQRHSTYLLTHVLFTTYCLTVVSLRLKNASCAESAPAPQTAALRRVAQAYRTPTLSSL